MKPLGARLCALVLPTFAMGGCGDRGTLEEGEEMPTVPSMSAQAIHATVMTIDSHDDIPFDFATEAVDPLDAPRQVNLQKMRAGGLDMGFFIVYVGQTQRTPENYARAQADAMTKFDAIHRMTGEMYPDLIELAYSADDVERIHASGKLVAAIGIENGYVIGRDLSTPGTLPPAWRPLRHPGPQRPQRHCRFRASAAGAGGCARGTQRHQRVRRTGHCGDEPVGDHGGCLPYLEGRGPGRDPLVPGAGHRVALQHPRDHRPSPQHGRRDAAGASRQWRGHASHGSRGFRQGADASAPGRHSRDPRRVRHREFP